MSPQTVNRIHWGSAIAAVAALTVLAAHFIWVGDTFANKADKETVRAQDVRITMLEVQMIHMQSDLSDINDKLDRLLEFHLESQ